MGGSNATLSIVLQLVDEATAAMQGVSEKTKKSLEDIQSKANEVRDAFGLLGGAIIGGLGVLVDAAANNITAEGQLTSAVKAGIAAAQDDTASTDLLAKQKSLLQAQLTGLNGKIQEYKDKIEAGKDANGQYAAGLDLLQQKVSGVQDKLSTLNNEQKLATQNIEEIVRQFDAAAKAGTDYGFANDDTIKTLTTLFRATGDVTQSLKANQEAMDLARAKGIDLTTAGTLIVQAMEGNGRALKQFGINLKDGLTPAEALNELQIKLAGSAKDYVNTPWGQLDVAKAKAGALAETLGADLIPVLTNFLQTVTPLIEKVTAWAEAHPKLTSYILLTVGALGLLALGVAAIAGIISAAISVFLVFSTVIAAVGVVVGVIGLPIIALGVLIGVLAYLWITRWNDIKGGAQIVLDYLHALFQSWSDKIMKLWTDLWSFITGIVNNVLGAVSRVMSAVSSITGAAANVGSSMLSMVPHFATGGIVSSPTLALVGEAGPEAIIPLSAFVGGSSLSSAGIAGGGGVVVNILGGYYLDSTGAKMLARAVGDEIVRTLRLNQKMTI